MINIGGIQILKRFQNTILINDIITHNGKIRINSIITHNGMILIDLKLIILGIFLLPPQLSGYASLLLYFFTPFLPYFYLSCFLRNLPALLQLSHIYLNFYLTLFLLLFILMLISKNNSLFSHLLREFLLICMQQSILSLIPYSLYYFLIGN